MKLKTEHTRNNLYGPVKGQRGQRLHAPAYSECDAVYRPLDGNTTPVTHLKVETQNVSKQEQEHSVSQGSQVDHQQVDEPRQQAEVHTEEQLTSKQDPTIEALDVAVEEHASGYVADLTLDHPLDEVCPIGEAREVPTQPAGNSDHDCRSKEEAGRAVHPSLPALDYITVENP